MTQLVQMSAASYDWTRVDEAFASAAVEYRPNLTAHDAQHTRIRPVFPGASLVVGVGGEVVYNRTVGCRSIVPEVTPAFDGLVYDVASLTKVMVTTTIAMLLVEQGELSLDRRLSRIFQTFGTHGKESMTIRHLLTHTSGYPATAPFYKSIARADKAERSNVLTSRGAKEIILNEIFRSKLENMPGKATRYSDIGFILLGSAIETITGGTLDRIAQKSIFRPLGMDSTGYIDLTTIRRRGLEPVLDSLAPTARCPWRGRILCGEVHDDNAWAMGGIAAHAGVFSTAADVHRFGWEMIRCYRGESSFINRDVVREFWTVAGIDPSSTWALGWDTPSKKGSSSGKHFSAGTVGHLGFTGCSLWIDPERELVVVLLSNRVHPSIDNNLIREFRPVIHDLVLETLGYGK